MSWSVIRKATAEDTELLERCGAAFTVRHSIPVDEMTSALDAIEGHLSYLASYGQSDHNREQGQRLSRLWLRVVRRALRSKAAEGIAHGYVGFTVH